eukprot:192483-Pyramimonas_sp.AAC.1
MPPIFRTHAPAVSKTRGNAGCDTKKRLSWFVLGFEKTGTVGRPGSGTAGGRPVPDGYEYVTPAGGRPVPDGYENVTPA